MSTDIDRVLGFWLTEVGPKMWLQPNAETIQKSLDFEDLWTQAAAGDLASWMCKPRACLALVVLLGQLPKMMFGDDPKAYSTEAAALAVAKRAIVLGHDLKTREPERRFFYAPLMQSESLMDQERCVRLIALRMPQAEMTFLAHSQAHRDIIRQFGRFPQRNAALGRKDTQAEEAYLSAGGYSSTMQAVLAA